MRAIRVGWKGVGRREEEALLARAEGCRAGGRGSASLEAARETLLVVWIDRWISAIFPPIPWLLSLFSINGVSLGLVLLMAETEAYGGTEMAETTRLRDPGSRKDRDRDGDGGRSSRSKRRRGERIMLHASNRNEGDESSEESDAEEGDDDEETSVPVRFLPPPPPPPNPASSSVLPAQNHHPYHSSSNNPNHHHQQAQLKSLPRAPALWKPDDVIGLSVPRKARSASTKRSSHEWLVSGGGSTDSLQIQRKSSASPSRSKPASAPQVSLSSSDATVRKKMKPISGSNQCPQKISKAASFKEEELEVAQVLFGMTRQLQPSPKQENHKFEAKDTSESRSGVSSPNSISLPALATAPSILHPLAPKWKQPTVVKSEDEIPAGPAESPSFPSTSGSSGALTEAEPRRKLEALPKPDKNPEPSATVENGGPCHQPIAALLDSRQKPEKNKEIPSFDPKLLEGEAIRHDRLQSQEEPTLPTKGTASSTDSGQPTATKTELSSNGIRKHKLTIDLMAPSERDGCSDLDVDRESLGPGTEMVTQLTIEKKEENKKAQLNHLEKPMLEDLKKLMAKERSLDPQLDLEKPEMVISSTNKAQTEKQQPKAIKGDTRQEKTGTDAALAAPMAVGSWPGGFPSFGYMGQVPPFPSAIIAVNSNPGPSSTIQARALLAPQRISKRCATHCYIAQYIHYHQQLAKMNPFWHMATGSTAAFRAKPFSVPPTEAALHGSSLQGALLGKNSPSMQDANGQPAAAAPVNPSKEKMPSSTSSVMESVQTKPLVHQQAPSQAGSMTNMQHGPASIIPLNQPQAVAAAASRAGTGVGNGMLPFETFTPAMSSVAGGLASAMNPSFAGLPPVEAQFLAVFQNGAYPFPIPTHVGGPALYRGSAPPQAVPFLNGPFYSSQILHPSQIPLQQRQLLLQQPRPQGPQQPPNAQHVLQISAASNGSTSSQKQPLQTQGVPGNQRPHLLISQILQQDGNKSSEDSPSAADSVVSQTQKNIYDHNFTLSVHPQKFAHMSAAGAPAVLNSSVSLSEKRSRDQQQQQQQPSRNQKNKLNLKSSQHFATPFASSSVQVAGPTGVEFASMAHNHPLFQSCQETGSQGDPQIALASAAQTSQQQSRHQITGNGKFLTGDSTTTVVTVEDEMKISVTGKVLGGNSQHSLSFSRTENEPPLSSILSSSLSDGNSRVLNHAPASANNINMVSKPSNTVGPHTVISSVMPAASVPSSQKLQQIQLKNQQEHLQKQYQLPSSYPKSTAPSANSGGYSDRLSSSSNLTNFPQSLMNFPQALIQGGGNPSQLPQWNASAIRSPATAPVPPSSMLSMTKNHHHIQQQARVPQQALSSPSHQTQISFAKNALRVSPSGTNLSAGVTDQPQSSAASLAAASPSSSASKSVGGSLPAGFSSTKPSPSTMALPPQQPVKISSPTSSSKSSVPGHHSAQSILGRPSMAHAPNTSSKQQQLQPPQLKQQPFPQPRFFSNAGYFQKCQSEKLPQQPQIHQQNSTSGLSATIAVSSSLVADDAPSPSDPAKALAAAAAATSNIKGLGPLTATSQIASGAPHAITPSFACISTPPMSVKPATD